jgi:hypothetical protein
MDLPEHSRSICLYHDKAMDVFTRVLAIPSIRSTFIGDFVIEKDSTSRADRVIEFFCECAIPSTAGFHGINYVDPMPAASPGSLYIGGTEMHMSYWHMASAWNTVSLHKYMGCSQILSLSFSRMILFRPNHDCIPSKDFYFITFSQRDSV